MSDKLVVNELLAFLQQKLDVMDEVSAVQICKSSFSEEDISVAKKLLFGSLNKSDRMVSHRRDGTPKSLQEIITLLKETDPDDVPTFVARDLNKLPPVTFDHVDVTSLLKDIVTMKAGLADVVLKYEASQIAVSELRKEVDSLRASLAVTRSVVDDSNVNTRRGAFVNAPRLSFESAFSTPTSSPCSADAAVARARTPARCAPQSPAPAPRAPQSPAPRAPQPPAPRAVQPADVAPRAPPPLSRPAPSPAVPHVTAVPEPVTQQTKPSRRDYASVAASNLAAQRVSERAAMDRDDDGFVKVQRKRARRNRPNQNRCGTALTGPQFLLRAATPTTPMYLSRLHHTITVQDVIEYIKTKTNFLLRVEPLGSRHNVSFKAFVVRVPTSKLADTFMKEDFWPKGVVYRRFRGRLPVNTTGAAQYGAK